MHSSNDSSTVDSLANFESAIRASREELQREQQRLDSLRASVKTAEERVRSFQREITDATDRHEILENECGRIAHANNQRREQINFIRSQMETIVAPRTVIEAQTSEIKRAVAGTRRDLCKGTIRTTTEILTSLREHDPEELKRRVAAKRAECAAAAARVTKYRSDLAILKRAAEVRAAEAEARQRKKALEEEEEQRKQSSTSLHRRDHVDGRIEETDNPNDLSALRQQQQLSATESLRARLLEALLENRFTLSKEIERVTLQLTTKRAENVTRTDEFMAAREEARAHIRAFGHSMPMSEQLAANAEDAYHELLDRSNGVTCCQCGAELGFEPIVSA